MKPLSAVILAAGQGTRMKSALPKVLHPVGGRPMIHWALESARCLDAEPIVLVVGYGAQQVRQAVGDEVLYALQEQQLGTAHATLQARPLLLGKTDAVLVLYGDMPALRIETLERLVGLHRQHRPALTMLTVVADDSMGFGRVVRDQAGRIRAVVEEAAATAEILALKELNCGVYCFDAAWLWERLPDVPMTPPKNEYYLTDMVGLAVQDGREVQALTIDDVREVQGINTRVHLARCERILRERINEELMLSGVTLVDPHTTYIESGVRVGQDTVIHPNTHLLGRTVVGRDCVIGPNAILRDTRVGDRCLVLASVLEEAILEDEVSIGPFGHLRPGAHLGRGVHMGNFGEVKNAYLAPGTKMGHFSYIGDAELGPDVNVGAGTVTCNYDGQRKHRTVIGQGAFIGSGTMLVAPVTIGRGAKIGAGSVVTRDIPDGVLAYGVPARVRRPVEGEASDPSDEKT
ncbi:MAG: bifunctional UDP-N-acetylglucosamine diphosphorylase/glucosamine-1-phosphate N-acetyltransferase GlmU [Chloroflexi bacterium]|nr:bifunctional UDP-N-acetylglucosamine diphosphorylase/glucosamine-1-phosphate N-acetyltransferase GlmU [Chloroflexota bacterium]